MQAQAFQNKLGLSENKLCDLLSQWSFATEEAREMIWGFQLWETCLNEELASAPGRSACWFLPWLWVDKVPCWWQEAGKLDSWGFAWHSRINTQAEHALIYISCMEYAIKSYVREIKKHERSLNVGCDSVARSSKGNLYSYTFYPWLQYDNEYCIPDYGWQ